MRLLHYFRIGRILYHLYSQHVEPNGSTLRIESAQDGRMSTPYELAEVLRRLDRKVH